MNFSKLKALFELVRPVNLLLVFLTIAAAAVLAGAQSEQWQLIALAAVSGALIAGGGYAINDYYDVEIDAVNKPQRPLPSGALSRSEAWWTWRIVSSAGVIASAFIGPYPLGIAICWVISLYFYSRRFKRSILIGNLLVGLVTGLAFVFGGAAVGNLEQSFVPAVFAFLVNLARELVKDVEDLEGDAREYAGTLPVKHGIRPALVLASVTLLILIGSTLAAYRWGGYNLRYLAIVAVVDASFVWAIISMWRDSSPKNMRLLSTLLKVDMLIGLLAIYLGTAP
ncbi:MAG TPA: geranylgeranylglycerol-phosphate geranylgeranyltransferase [Bacteroidota bacterium]